MSTRTLFGCWLLVASAGACSDGDGGGGSSGVPAETKLVELSAEQAQQLCEFQERSYKNALPASEEACTFEAALSSQDAEQCVEWRDQCVAAGDFDNEREDDWECEDSSVEDLFEEEVFAACEVTVGEAEACIRAALAAYRTAAGRASCDDVEGSSEDEVETEECRTILDKCPGLDDDLFG